MFFFFKQKTAYEMRISDWSSDVCSSDLRAGVAAVAGEVQRTAAGLGEAAVALDFAGEFAVAFLIDGQLVGADVDVRPLAARQPGNRLIVTAEVERTAADVEFGFRSEEHTSELQSLMRISYAVFCLKKKQ